MGNELGRHFKPITRTLAPGLTPVSDRLHPSAGRVAATPRPAPEPTHPTGTNQRKPGRRSDNARVISILLVTFPFFALVACGYFATRRGWLPVSAIPGLNGFVLFFALPAMLFRFGATTPVGQSLDPAVIGVYLICALLMVAITLGYARWRGTGWIDSAFGALVAAFPNTGYMGVPLLVALLGPAAAGPIIATILVDLVFTSSLCIGLSQLGTHGAHGVAVAVRQALRGMLSNPLPWAIGAGAACSASGLALPTPLMKTVGLLADAASPVALFTIGAVLARAQGDAPTRPADYLPVAAKKLVLHPLLVWGVGSLAIALGLALDPFAFKVLILVAALPSASNVAMLAERFGADNGRIARIILASTALAFVSFAAAVDWLN